MKQSDAELQADISKVRSLRGFIDNDKRLSYALDSEEVAEVPDTEHVRFCRTNIFWNGRWLQIWIIYSLPRSTQAGIISTYSLPICLAFTTPRWAGRTTNNGTVIVSKKILKEHSVKFLIFYKKIGLHLSTMHYFLTSNWDFSANINEQELDGFYDVGVFHSITTFNSIRALFFDFFFLFYKYL